MTRGYGFQNKTVSTPQKETKLKPFVLAFVKVELKRTWQAI